MPFCRTRLSAKRFIAGVGGYVPVPLLLALPSKEGTPAVAPSFSLLIMRSATSHTASMAPTSGFVTRVGVDRERLIKGARADRSVQQGFDQPSFSDTGQ